MICCCCQSALDPGLADWHFVCRACGYEHATLRPSVNDLRLHDALDEAQREAGLKALRQSNFETLLALVGALRPRMGEESLLEVGAGHGWFIELARRRFAATLGIEPDREVARRAAEHGIALRQGYFPQALAPQERFDVIVFNDVFEHIPDADAALDAVRSHLQAGGALVLNLPSAEGIFYRLARNLRRFGIRGPFQRMWQVGMPSPHVHYFSARSMRLLLSRNGFRVVATTTLPALRVRHLYARIALSRDHGWLVRRAMWLGLIVLFPLLAVLPRDIRVFVCTAAAAEPAA